MTKARTKGQRRRQRQRAITLPGGARIPQPATQGRRVDLEPQEPADLIALSARARLTGCTVEVARDVLAGEDMGRCILALARSPERRRDLLGVWQGLNAAWVNFATRCLSVTPTPQAAALPMLPDPVQTDQSLRIDPRTADEKDEAARRVWYEWIDLLMHRLTAPQRHALRGSLQGYGAEVWNPNTRKPTKAGHLAVEALAALHAARTA